MKSGGATEYDVQVCRTKNTAARFAGYDSELVLDPRAYARGYYLPRLRRSVSFTLADLFD